MRRKSEPLIPFNDLRNFRNPHFPKDNSAKKRPKKTLTILECGCCGCYHPDDYFGDCRDDENRFGSPEEAAKRMGKKVIAIDLENLPAQ